MKPLGTFSANEIMDKVVVLLLKKLKPNAEQKLKPNAEQKPDKKEAEKTEETASHSRAKTNWKRAVETAHMTESAALAVTDKKHEFNDYDFKKPTFCDYCKDCIRQGTRKSVGVRCKVCRISLHLKCCECVPNCPGESLDSKFGWMHGGSSHMNVMYYRYDKKAVKPDAVYEVLKGAAKKTSGKESESDAETPFPQKTRTKSKRSSCKRSSSERHRKRGTSRRDKPPVNRSSSSNTHQRNLEQRYSDPPPVTREDRTGSKSHRAKQPVSSGNLKTPKTLNVIGGSNGSISPQVSSEEYDNGATSSQNRKLRWQWNT